MSILSLIIKIFFLWLWVNVDGISLFKVLDCKIGDDSILNCPINRNNWSHPIIFQWYRSINNYSIPIASQFDDYPIHINDIYQQRYHLLNNGSLKIDNVQFDDNDTYQCRLILIDRGLMDIKEKYSVTLRVNEPPRFINQSDSIQIADLHSTVNLLCGIYGVPSPTITWYKITQKNRQTIGKEDLQLLSVNSQQLVLQHVDDRMAGSYRCIGKNRLGLVQNEFQLLIRGSIYWRHQPESQTVKMNDSIILKCEGESSEALQYQWLKDNTSLADTISSQGRIRTFTDGVLSIQKIEPSDHGLYICIVSIINSTRIPSKPAIITVKYPPIPPTNRRQINNLTLIEGSLGICPCLLQAYPPIQSVSWYRNGQSIRIQSKTGIYTINSDYALVIKSVEREDHGTYVCRAQNSEGFGHDSIPIFVEIKEPIKFISKPDSIYHVHEKDRLILPCVVSARPRPFIKWFKNAMELNENNENLTIEYIEKTDHGLYICQASNAYTTTNTSTLVIVENTTPQAPLNVRYEQISFNLLLSWEPGYDGGRLQHFIIWYRMIQTKKQNWNQIRVIPENATEFLLFDLKLQQTYEVTIVGENEYGLGTFSPIISIHLNNLHDLSIGYLHHTNESDLLRPFSPTSLKLAHSGTDLHITWNHPNVFESPIYITYYVIRWRSTIVFNNQQSQEFLVLEYPTQSYILKDIKQSKYIIQILSYSQRGTYSLAIESEIDIHFNSILAYHGSNRFLVPMLCFLTALTVATLCICIFFILRCYYHRGSYSTDRKSNFKFICGCIPLLPYRLDDCSPMELDRYHTSLLKSIDFQSTPICTSHHRITSATAGKSCRSTSPLNKLTNSSISLAKVTTIPRCREPLNSSAVPSSKLTRSSVSIDNVHTVASPTAKPLANDDNQMVSFFQPISDTNISTTVSNDVESRKSNARLTLQAVPELSELHLANSRRSFIQPFSSTIPNSHRVNSVQASPLLITFDSSSLQRRT